MLEKISKNIVSENQSSVILMLVDFFECYGIDYQFTGGFSANLFGSQWKLKDIDIETNLKSLYIIQREFQRQIVNPIQRYVDDEFDIWLLQLRINNIDIDINAIEDFYIKPNFKIETKLEDCVYISFRGKIIRTQHLKNIIEYKQILNRHNDLKELMLINPI